MSDASGGGEKTHEATPKKLEDARKKGDIPRSNEVTTAAAYMGLLLAFLGAGFAFVERSGTVLSGLLAKAEFVSASGGGGLGLLGAAFMDIFPYLAPIFFLPMAACLMSILGQRALIFAPSKIAPKLSRISMITGAKNKFGLSGLVEFAKSFFKLTIISISVAWLLSNRIDEFMGAVHAEGRIVGALMADMLVSLLILVTTIAIGIALFDLLWQRFNHARKNLMSHQELRDEFKEAEGDPHVKSQRRSRAQEIATNRMLVDVPTADVIIVNPTHYAVALKWARVGSAAPVCVAKGQDEVAARIREVAAEAGIPIHRDAPTARALHALVKIGDEIPPEQYRAVAVAIQFADKMRAMASKGAR